MADEKTYRLSQVARKLNVGRNTILDFLSTKGFDVDSSPNSKISQEQYVLLSKEFADSALDKEEASGLTIGTSHVENVTIKSSDAKKADEEERVLIKDNNSAAPVPPKKEEIKKVEPKAKEEVKEEKQEPLTSKPTLSGTKVIGKIDLSTLGKKPKQEEPKPVEAKPETPLKEKSKPKVEEPKAEELKIEKAAAPEVVKKEEAKQEEPKVEASKEAKTFNPQTVEEPAKEDNPKPEPVKEEQKKEEEKKEEPKVAFPKVEAKQGLTLKPADEKIENKEGPKEVRREDQVIEAKADSLKGLTVIGKIELPADKRKAKPVASSDENKDRKKRPRKRIAPATGAGSRPNAGGNRPGSAGGSRPGGPNRPAGGQRPPAAPRRDPRKTEELTDKEIQDKIKATLAKLSGGGNQGGGGNRSKYRKDKRSAKADAEEERNLQNQQEAKKLKVTEFISASDLASLLDITVNDIISTCMSLGMFVSINQRLDAESITVIADEYGFDVEFTGDDEEIEVQVVIDAKEDLIHRAPIVTIMGHVDHGKTSLLDYIRSAKVTEGEAGGITQHIGAYDVMTENGKRVAFLDTPGHEAFTAMRARGAKITDIAIIVIAADDAVMPQTKEAINHAQVAGVPIVFAINKVDRPNSNPEKIKEQLSAINILVEDWGGKYQSQHVSAKTGEGIDDLLEKVLLEAELLDLNANPNKPALGTVVEATLDKGRGYVTTMMVQAGTMRIGDVVLAGANFGKVKAMYDHRGKRLLEVGPATPVQMLGLDGAPQAGDRFNVMESDRAAREIATKRGQINREQSIRTKKHITLDEIGRRLAIGSFKELNVIVKGDVDGSIEALSYSLLKLSTEEVQVNII
ncbi:MAG: translation initiation factor IF-2, partial [Cyclobacteriaceae bacterium]